MSAASRLRSMGDAAREKAREETRKAQANYDAAEAKFQEQIAKARRARRATFRKAQAAGLTQREIAEAAGLHHTRVGAILRED
jgi:DNA-directed RNA polymerase specialized sigma24 family protein